MHEYVKADDEDAYEVKVKSLVKAREDVQREMAKIVLRVSSST